MVERFEASTGTRLRAFHGKPNPIYPDGTILAFGAGELRMKSDEWFMSDAVIELFLRFLRCEPYPEQIYWRSAPGV